MKAGLLVAVGTAVALPAMFGGLFLMESFKPLLFALPFFAGFAAYLTGLLWSNWRQSHSLT